MTEGIMNADGSRNWQANILLDNVKRLEFELKVTKADYEASEQENKSNKELLIIAQNEAMEAQFDREKYKSALEVIQKMILSAWEQGKYLDGGLYNDLTNEFAKINEVLK